MQSVPVPFGSVSQGLALADGDETTIYVDGEPRSVSELRGQFACWLRPAEPPESTEGFFSYSHDTEEYGARFVARVHDASEANGLSIFLDRTSLRRGEQIDYACLLGMAHSKVLTPFVSWSALRRLSVLGEGSPCSYLLLEWTFACILHEQHEVPIFPIFVGCSDADGTADPSRDLFAAKPPRASASSAGLDNEIGADGKLVPDERAVFDRMPRTAVASVTARRQGRTTGKHVC